MYADTYSTLHTRLIHTICAFNDKDGRYCIKHGEVIQLGCITRNVDIRFSLIRTSGRAIKRSLVTTSRSARHYIEQYHPDRVRIGDTIDIRQLNNLIAAHPHIPFDVTITAITDISSIQRLHGTIYIRCSESHICQWEGYLRQGRHKTPTDAGLHIKSIYLFTDNDASVVYAFDIEKLRTLQYVSLQGIDNAEPVIELLYERINRGYDPIEILDLTHCEVPEIEAKIANHLIIDESHHIWREHARSYLPG